MSLLKRLEPKPEEDLYFAFKEFFDILETERQKREAKRRTVVVRPAWYEEEFKEME